MREWLPFELLTYFVLASSVVLGFLAGRRLNRAVKWKRYVSRGIFIFMAFTFLIVFYGSFIESRKIVITRQTIPLAHAPTGPIKIALVSDMHLGVYKKSGYVRRMVKQILKEKPDVVILAGDFIFAQEINGQTQHFSPLKELTAQIPTYAVLGNHEYGKGMPDWPSHPEIASYVKMRLEEVGVRILQNETVPFETASAKIYLAGSDEVWVNPPIFKNLIKDKMRPVILIAHNPDIVLFMPRDIFPDLVLAGHTHGGQIRLPLIGAVPPIPTILGKAFDKGLKFWNTIPVFITSGIGESGPRARLFNPPEVAIITVR